MLALSSSFAASYALALLCGRVFYIAVKFLQLGLLWRLRKFQNLRGHGDIGAILFLARGGFAEALRRLRRSVAEKGCAKASALRFERPFGSMMAR